MESRQTREVTVSVIIPVFNKWELTKACLQSLATHKPAATYEVIVVDNASQDETYACCAALGHSLFGKYFTYLRQAKNKNFSGACNIGAHSAQGDFLFFLNNDTVVTEKWLDPLLDNFQQHQNIAAVGPLLLYPQLGTLKERVQHVGVSIDPFMQPFHLYEGLPAGHKIVTRSRATQVITGAAMLMPRHLFLAHNGFNEAYVNGFEDVDLCARLWSNGYAMLIEPAAKIYHLQSQSPGRHDYEAENSALLSKTSLTLLSPDMHIQLQADGLEIGLSDWLVFYPKMPLKMAKMLSERFLHPGNEAHVVTLLHEEPFWYEGYAWLAEQLEVQNNWEEAFSWRLIAAKLKTDLDTILPLLPAANKVGEKRTVDYCFAVISQWLFSTSFFVKSAENFYQWALVHGVDVITSQCEAWLANKEQFREKKLLPAIKELHRLGVFKRSIGNRCRLSYTCYVELQEKLQVGKEQNDKEHLKKLALRPLISILMPVYNPKAEDFEATIQSVQQQFYANWQLCIADDASTDPDVVRLLKEYAERDPRISVIFRKTNGHICAASNSALELVQGEYTILMDHDDLLPRHALLEVVSALEKNPGTMVLYSDEDKFNDFVTHSDVYYKPAFDPDLICSQNYFNHISTYKTSLLRDVGGFREGLEGAQDHDLLLRCLEKIKPEQIIHIPQVLYHWRVHGGSTSESIEAKPYAIASGLRAVQEHFARTGRNAVVERHDDCNYYKIKDSLPNNDVRLSLILATNEVTNATQHWLEQFLKSTNYANLELFILHSDTNRQTCKDPRVEFIHVGKSEIHNLRPALDIATGEIIGHIQAGLLSYEPVWLEQIIASLFRPEVGVVGGRVFDAQQILKSAGFGITKEGLIFPYFAGTHRKRDSGYYYQHGLIRNVFMCGQEYFFAKKIDFMRYYCETLESLWPAEFCMRVREKGLRVLCTPDADLYIQQNFPYDNQRMHNEHLLGLFSQKWGQKLVGQALHPMLTPTFGGYCINFSSLL